LSSNLVAGLGFGVLLLIGIPILATLVFAFGLLIGGWWLGLVLFFLYALALGVGYVVSAMLLGEVLLARLLPDRAHVVLSLLVGVLVLGSLALIPVVGAIVSSAAMTVGLGSLGLVAMHMYRGQRQQPVVTPTAKEQVIAVPAPA
jgi:MFS family permease